MERLQNALEKARSERLAKTADPTLASAPPSSVAQRWSELEGYAPNVKQLNRNRVMAYDAGPVATAFDVLRTKIILQMRKNGWKRLAITSPTMGCGKTTTCVNLAAGLSRQADLRTILFELDLRRPTMTNRLSMTPPHSITEMLTGEVSFAQQAVRLRDTVALSIAKGAAPDPTQLLLSTSTDKQFDQIAQNYEPDLMIFDLPPIMTGDDTRAFLSRADCALIIAKAEKSTVAQIDASEREVAEHTNVLGVVLNQSRFAENGPGMARNEDY